MSERYCGWIRIGGRIERSRIDPLLREINQASVKLDWGEPLFEPKTADELLEARADDRLRLCDEEAYYGEFPELEKICRDLGLAYERSCEAWCGCDAEIVQWRPGMEKPVIRTCSNADFEVVLLDSRVVHEALVSLEAGRHQEAIGRLMNLFPEVPDLPIFEVV